jgi:hypothetical protein
VACVVHDPGDVFQADTLKRFQVKTRAFRQSGPQWLGASALALCLGVPQFAAAVPITITNTNVWRADRTANPIGFLPTSLVPWIEVTTAPGGNVADTRVSATVGGTTFNLNRIATGILQGIYFAQIPYNDAFTSDWTITATNGSDMATTIRPGFLPTQAMPFVSDIGFTGIGNDIRVNWTVTPEGASQLVTQQVTIWDFSAPAAPVTVRFFNIGSTPRTVDLSTLELDPGVPYAVEINNLRRNPATGFIDAFSGNWLSGWTPTSEGEVQLPPVAVPEPGTLALLMISLAGMGVMHRRRVVKAA